MIMFHEAKKAIKFVIADFEEVAFLVNKKNPSKSKLLSRSQETLEHLGARHGCLNLPKLYDDGEKICFYHLKLNSIALQEIFEEMGYSLEALELKNEVV